MIRQAMAVIAAMAMLQPVDARPRALTAAEWRTDLAELDAAIRDTHPRPFLRVSEADYTAAVAALDSDIPGLADKAIVVRLAAIVALLDDGHTRLTLPRQHPGLGLEFGHTRTAQPTETALHFSQLPVAFAHFEDGLFVVGAATEHRDLIGRRLVSIGARSAEQALDAIRSIAAADNVRAERSMGVDLLSLPDALAALGIAAHADWIDAVLSDSVGVTSSHRFKPLPLGDIEWHSGSDANALRAHQTARKLWSTYLPASRAVYARIDEITDADPGFAAFAEAIVAEAEAHDARLVIDLRDNTGGNGELNRVLLLALLRSETLNQWGRLFVLIGPRTFSAAQLLTNQLERYTRALFVGEPTGARPDHYGDSKRVRLGHSELTLRVSTLHWSSLIGSDAREATFPDLPAPWTSRAWFDGRDPALTLALTSPGMDLRARVTAALERSDQYQVYRYLADVRLSPGSHGANVSGDLLAVGRDFETRGRHDLASFAYRYGLAYDPDNEVLKAMLGALPSP